MSMFEKVEKVEAKPEVKPDAKPEPRPVPVVPPPPSPEVLALKAELATVKAYVKTLEEKLIMAHGHIRNYTPPLSWEALQIKK